ncbi:unnamed protein product, partial [Didymodactylos carnosus]
MEHSLVYFGSGWDISPILFDFQLKININFQTFIFVDRLPLHPHYVPTTKDYMLSGGGGSDRRLLFSISKALSNNNLSVNEEKHNKDRHQYMLSNGKKLVVYLNIAYPPETNKNMHIDEFLYEIKSAEGLWVYGYDPVPNEQLLILCHNIKFVFQQTQNVLERFPILPQIQVFYICYSNLILLESLERTQDDNNVLADYRRNPTKYNLEF